MPWTHTLCILCVHTCIPFSKIIYEFSFDVAFIQDLLKAVCLMQLNHIFKTRDLVKKNDSKIAKHRETSEEEILSDDGFLDQGFTRPKVTPSAFLLQMFYVFKFVVAYI